MGDGCDIIRDDFDFRKEIQNGFRLQQFLGQGPVILGMAQLLNGQGRLYIELSDLFPDQLSGGQQQLVAVARAIIMKPRLILADEPTGNLNSEQGTEIMELLKRLNQEGTTILQVTHSKEKAAYGNRIIHLLDGRIEKEE